MLQGLRGASGQPAVERAYPETGCRREQGNPGSAPVSDKTLQKDSLPASQTVRSFSLLLQILVKTQVSRRAIREAPRVHRESLSGPPRRPPLDLRRLRPSSHAAHQRTAVCRAAVCSSTSLATSAASLGTTRSCNHAAGLRPQILLTAFFYFTTLLHMRCQASAILCELGLARF